MDSVYDHQPSFNNATSNNNPQHDELHFSGRASLEQPLKFLSALTNDIPDYSVHRSSNASLWLPGYTDLYVLTTRVHGSDTETRS